MRSLTMTFAWLPLLLLQLAGFTLDARAEAKEGKAVVAAIRGGATFSPAIGSNFEPLKVGAVLKAGATVKTDATSEVDLDLGPNGNGLRVKPGSTLTITKLTFENTGLDVISDTQLDLKSGNLIGSIKKLSSTSKYEVKTATGVAGIRGTSFQIYSDGSVTVTEGSVSINYYPPGATTPTVFIVNAGETFQLPTRPGSSPTVGPTPPSTRAALLAEVSDVDAIDVQVERTFEKGRIITTVVYSSPLTGEPIVTIKR